MSDVDTSAEAVGRIVLKLVEPPSHWHERHAAEIIRALLRERDEARAALGQAIMNEQARHAALYARADIAAILRGEAVAVPVEATEAMCFAIDNGTVSLAQAYRDMIAASPYAPKEPAR